MSLFDSISAIFKPKTPKKKEVIIYAIIISSGGLGPVKTGFVPASTPLFSNQEDALAYVRAMREKGYDVASFPIRATEDYVFELKKVGRLR